MTEPADEALTDEPDDQPDERIDSARPVANGGRVHALPWYRRGTVWLVFVLLTAFAAAWVSYLAEDRLYAFDVDPTDPQVLLWCDRVEAPRSASLAGAVTTAEGGDFVVDPTILERLADDAPSDISRELTILASAARDMDAATRELSDPEEQLRSFERTSASVRRHANRVDRFVSEICFPG